MNISALRGRPLRLFSVLTGGAAVVLVLGAAAPSLAADTPARTPITAARATASGGTWGPVKTVAAALNTGGSAAINSMSCAAAGNCTAGGYYTDSTEKLQAFVVSKTNGTWGPARNVAAALNTLGVAAINSVSCGSAGNCTAGGYYSVTSPHSQQAFVITETNGTWGPVKNVAAALNTGGSARINSVSCAAAGNCTAGGYYTGNSGAQQAFVITETNGTWGPAKNVAAALNTGGSAQINSVSCAAAGNCSAGGYYRDVSTHSTQAFVITETNGTWGRATEVAAALNALGAARIDSVSCGSAGNCSAGGFYTDISQHAQAFVVNETNGAWGTAREVAAALDTGGGARIDSVSCAAAGNCSAGGDYSPSSGQQAFVINETNGTWGPAKKVATALNTGGFAETSSVSCGSPGNCSASGYYTDSHGTQAFVVNETNGTWGTATEMAAALNTGGDAWAYSVSCAAAGNCSAGGFYTGNSGHAQAFVVSKP
jgi:hypothetical protein